MFAKYYPNGEPGVKFAGCSIRFGGALLLSGSLVVTQATTDSYQCWLQSNLGVMGEALQEKTLQDMPWPTNQVFAAKSSYNDEADDYGVMVIKNPGFWDGKGREADNIPMAYTDENGDPQTKLETRSALSGEHWANYAWLVNNQISAPPAFEKGAVISPFLYLRYVIRESLRMNGWYINRNDMTSNPLFPLLPMAVCSQLAIYNNVSIVEPEFTTVYTEYPGWNYETNEMEKKYDDIITEQSW
jgi:hypothetical protein